MRINPASKWLGAHVRASLFVVSGVCTMIGAVGLLLFTAVAQAETLLDVGDRVRFTRPGDTSREGAVVALAEDRIIVFEDPTVQIDTLLLDSLVSLEVRAKSVNTAVGFVAGAMLGGLVGTVVFAAAESQAEDTDWAPPAWMIGAPIGAFLGGFLGATYAHDRGTRWQPVPLPNSDARLSGPSRVGLALPITLWQTTLARGELRRCE